MKLTTETVQMLLIEDAKALDPIRVVLADYELGRGRMIIQCCDRAWCAYWGAMGQCTIGQFILTCDADYLVDNLLGGRLLIPRRQMLEQTYLMRIVEAVQAALREQAAADKGGAL
jgi:hypothetical protein